jgi:hypothetical protein
MRKNRQELLIKRGRGWQITKVVLTVNRIVSDIFFLVCPLFCRIIVPGRLLYSSRSGIPSSFNSDLTALLFILFYKSRLLMKLRTIDGVFDANKWYTCNRRLKIFHVFFPINTSKPSMFIYELINKKALVNGK